MGLGLRQEPRLKFEVTRAVLVMTAKEMRAGDTEDDVRNEEEADWPWEEGGGAFRGDRG